MIDSYLKAIRDLPKKFKFKDGSDRQASSDLAVQARDRIFVVMLGIAALFVIIQGRLVYLAANGEQGRIVRYNSDKALTAARPRILDRNGQIMALDIEVQEDHRRLRRF